MINPSPLQKGDRIGICSTSSAVEEKDILVAKDFMEAQGYEVFIHPQTTNRLNQSAGTPQEKAGALNELFADQSIKAIFSSRGGNRASTMLEFLDFDTIKQNPKILIGYSDLTILLNSIYQKTGLVGFHGPLFRELPTHPDFEQMIGVLSGEITSLDLSSCQILKTGPEEARGPILGGNLSVFQGLIGTPYMPDMKDAILLLEDISDHTSRYDRMFCHLKNAGILAQLSALIIGDFTDMKDNEDRPFGFTLEEVILEHSEKYDFPVLTGAPFGHADRLCTLPIGAPAKLCLKKMELSFKPLA
ncbi:MAG: LD-carboxypeptidase [Alphaproteobacteria bacterium]|nr:LD-carboxypeptidase [Alphaproteobacteria bacterium]